MFSLPRVSSPPNPLGVLLPGQVFAVGGLRDATGNLLLPGDSFVEPLSGKTVRLLGASQQAGRILPHTGGPQALLDANVLVAQRQVIMMLLQCQETPGSEALGHLEAAVKNMRQALALSLHHILQQARRLERQLEAACGIEASGGSIGMCSLGSLKSQSQNGSVFLLLSTQSRTSAPLAWHMCDQNKRTDQDQTL